MTHDIYSHATIREAGQCAACRARTLQLIQDQPRRYLLRFRSEEDAFALAVVPGYDFSNAVDNAWAVGCNPGGQVGGTELDDDVIERAAVPVCTLLRNAAAVAAEDALAAAIKDVLEGR